MPSNTDRIGLEVHTTADVFAIQDYADNWQLLDDFPGIFICTAGTRPTWDVNQEGMTIYETDTNLFWTWDGTAWQRHISKGYVGGAEVNADATNSTATYAEAISVPVTIAAGGRRHLIVVHASEVENDTGPTELAVFRDATLLQEWYQVGDGPGTPISMSIPDTPGAGAVDYTLQFRAVSGGTSTIHAEATKPIALDVIEL